MARQDKHTCRFAGIRRKPDQAEYEGSPMERHLPYAAHQSLNACLLIASRSADLGAKEDDVDLSVFCGSDVTAGPQARREAQEAGNSPVFDDRVIGRTCPNGVRRLG